MDEAKKYRTVQLGDRWQRSVFEYWNEQFQTWRTVINWNTRERLFDAAVAKASPENSPPFGK